MKKAERERKKSSKWRLLSYLKLGMFFIAISPNWCAVCLCQRVKWVTNYSDINPKIISSLISCNDSFKEFYVFLIFCSSLSCVSFCLTWSCLILVCIMRLHKWHLWLSISTRLERLSPHNGISKNLCLCHFTGMAQPHSWYQTLWDLGSPSANSPLWPFPGFQAQEQMTKTANRAFHKLMETLLNKCRI